MPTELSKLRMLRGVAAGLLHMHMCGQHHGDIRCANVLLTGDDKPMLADFGLARAMHGEGDVVISTEGRRMGPVRWCSPVTYARAACMSKQLRWYARAARVLDLAVA